MIRLPRQFLSDQLLQQGYTTLTPEESVAEFREYQKQLQRLRNELRPALEEHQRGEGSEIDISDIMERNRQRLANQGIIE